VPRVVVAVEILEGAHTRHDVEACKGTKRPYARRQQTPSQVLDVLLHASPELIVQIADTWCPGILIPAGVCRLGLMRCCLQHGRSLRYGVRHDRRRVRHCSRVETKASLHVLFLKPAERTPNKKGAGLEPRAF